MSHPLASHPTPPPSRTLGVHLALEIARERDVADRHATPSRPERCQRRQADGSYLSSVLRWTPDLARLLDEVRTGSAAEARQHVGLTLRAFLEGLGWEAEEAKVKAAVAPERLVVIKARFSPGGRGSPSAATSPPGTHRLAERRTP